tara:strand:- start:43 stop:213 length:171 start_codon:yes stop_codon:yes gene_type:complete
MSIALKIKDLEDSCQGILDRCEHWKNCSDGSYEMALSVAGYHEKIEYLFKLRGVAE